MTHITEVQNPAYGYDIARVWAEISGNLEHPAWDVIAEDALYYQALWDSMSAHFGKLALTDHEYHALTEAEQEEHDDLLEIMDDSVRSVSGDIELEFGVLSWIEEDMDDAEKIRVAVTLGMRLAHSLFTESEEESMTV